jgi:hypothetical protein
MSGDPHRSQNRELLSGAGAPQFPHFLLMYSLVNKNGGDIKTAVLLFPAGVIRQVIFFSVSLFPPEIAVVLSRVFPAWSSLL